MATVIPLSVKPLDDDSTPIRSLPRSESSAETIRIAMNNNKNEANRMNDAVDSPRILLNTFTARKKRYRVYYNAGIIIWERFNSEKGLFTFHLNYYLSS